MTRKRFVKLLMSQGMSRNTANACAAYVVTSNKSYEAEYKSYDAAYRLSGAFSSIGVSLHKATEAISTVCNAIGVAASAFSSVLAVSMQNPVTFGGRCPKCGGTGLEPRMQMMAQIGGSSMRGPDTYSVCSQCFGTGRSLL